MDSALAWLQAHQAAILAFLTLVLPSVITGLTPYPRAGGLVRVLQGLLDFFSVVTHRDSPGGFPSKAGATLKLPGMPSQAPGGKPPAGGAPLALLLALALLPLAQGCSWWQKAKDASITCASDEVKGKMANILPLVADVLQNGSNWQADLGIVEAMAGEYGADIVKCTVAKLLGMQGAGGPKLSPDARRRAADWLAK